jgi:hypothetical protein
MNSANIRRRGHPRAPSVMTANPAAAKHPAPFCVVDRRRFRLPATMALFPPRPNPGSLSPHPTATGGTRFGRKGLNIDAG